MRPGRRRGTTFDRQRGRLAEGTGFSFAIAEAGTGRGIGGIGLWLGALEHGRATAGYAVIPSSRGRGIACAALTALMSFAWTIPGLHRIELYIEPWNTGSVKTAERAGFKREGLLRSHQEIGGHRRDMLLYATIRETRPFPLGPHTLTPAGVHAPAVTGQGVDRYSTRHWVPSRALTIEHY
jgi:ribosomal-protein-alanine N-acetyltransferase